MTIAGFRSLSLPTTLAPSAAFTFRSDTTAVAARCRLLQGLGVTTKSALPVDQAPRNVAHRIVRLVVPIALVAFTMPLLAIVLGMPVMYDGYVTADQAMVPTLFPGDRFYARRALPSQDYGASVIVAAPPPDPPSPPERAPFTLGRVIGHGGDVVVIASDGSVRINDWPVPRCLVGTATLAIGEKGATPADIFVEYLGGSGYLIAETAQRPLQPETRLTVPRGEIFLLTDNRRPHADAASGTAPSGRVVPERALLDNPWKVWWSKEPNASGLAWRSVDRVRLPRSLALAADDALRSGFARCTANAPATFATFPPGPTKP